MNRRALVALELVFALIAAALGALSWTILFLLPVVAPPLILAPLALVKPTLLDRRWLRWPLHACSALCAIVAALFIGPLLLDTRSPEEHQLPDDYSGWVVIAYERPNGARAARANGGRLFRIPTSGLLATQDSVNTGWARGRSLPRYTYLSGATATIQRPSRGTFASGTCKFTFDQYWVGAGAIDAVNEPDFTSLCPPSP